MDQLHKPGLWYATTDDGLELPVIDVTHPDFIVHTSEQDIAERTQRFVEESRERLAMPPEARARTVEALHGSRLGRGLLQSSGGFVDSMTMYLMKLGPDNLGSFGNDMDRRIAASFPAWTTRLRLQAIADLMADGLGQHLQRNPERPLVIVDIAGGPAADAINALLILRSTRPETLAGRTIEIRVLDGDSTGPNFGARALAAMSSSEAPLAGLDIRFEYEAYDWNDADRLETCLDRWRHAFPLIACSSEGGLFEYGTDDAIRRNLCVLRDHSPADTVVVGSVTREDGIAAQTRALTGVAVSPRSVEQFTELAGSAGWRLDACVDGPLSRQVRLGR